MFSKLAKLSVVLALIFTVGAHWTLLQSVAWMGMTINFAQKDSLSDALSKTFDGKHPCPLCKLVQQGKESERRQDTQKITLKFDGLPAAAPTVLTAPALAPLPCQSLPLPGLSGHAPPSPPPRSLPA